MMNQKNNNNNNMGEREYQNTFNALFKDISDQDLDRMIIQLQFIRATRKREFQSKVRYGFCDNCLMTFPAILEECAKCEKTLRTLPIRAEYNYLLDGEPNTEDGGNHFVTIQE